MNFRWSYIYLSCSLAPKDLVMQRSASCLPFISTCNVRRQLMFNHLELSVFFMNVFLVFFKTRRHILLYEKKWKTERERERWGRGRGIDTEIREIYFVMHLVKQRSLYGALRLLAFLIRGRKWSKDTTIKTDLTD